MAVSLGACLAAVILLYVAATRDPGPFTTSVDSAGSVLLSIGVITLVYELLQKRKFAADLLEAVGISHKLAAVGVEDVCEESALDWQATLAEAATFHILLSNPSPWMDREWNHVVSAGRSRRIDVTVMLPEPTAAAFEFLADQLDFDEADLAQRVGRAREIVEETWKSASEAGPGLRKGSSIKVLPFEGIPGYGIVMADRMSVLILPSSLRRPGGETQTAISFRMSGDRFPAPWLQEQFRRFDQVVPSYENVVE